MKELKDDVDSAPQRGRGTRHHDNAGPNVKSKSNDSEDSFFENLMSELGSSLETESDNGGSSGGDSDDDFFANQGDLFRADRSYFVDAAVALGLDQATFEECYDSGTGHFAVTELDSARRQLGIFNRPTFDINGQLLVGSQPFSVFAQFIDAALQ